MSQVALGRATTTLAVCAVLVAGLPARGPFAPHPSGDVSTGPPGPLDPRLVANWREFREGGHRMGPPDAPIVIVEFADFQCPFCRRAVAALKDIRSRYPHEVALLYRHFPIHQFSFSAAVASECAARSGAFEPFHDALFAHPESIGTKQWARFANESGVQDTAHFERCLRDSSIAEHVWRDSRAAGKLGIQGTPAFLVNNVLLTGYAGPQQLDSIVEIEVAHTRFDQGKPQ